METFLLEWGEGGAAKIYNQKGLICNNFKHYFRQGGKVEL
jgi:hypothetical protein